MGQEATGLVEQWFDSVTERDLNRALGCLRKDIFFVPALRALGVLHAEFSGHEGFASWWVREFSDGLRLAAMEIEQLDDTRVYAEVLAGRPEGGEAGAAYTVACVFAIRDEKIALIEAFGDAETTLKRARELLA